MSGHHWAEAFAKNDAKVGETLRIGLTRYDPMMDCLVPVGITRFDPSTNTRVPVTQEWVDEAVAEIVRLNIEIGAGLAGKANAMLNQPNQFAEDILSEQDRIWEAVRAASAV